MFVNDRLLFDANSAIISYIMARTSYFQWDNDEFRFALDQHVYS